MKNQNKHTFRVNRREIVKKEENEDLPEGTVRVWHRWTMARQLRSARRGDNNQYLVMAAVAVLAGTTGEFRSDQGSGDGACWGN